MAKRPPKPPERESVPRHRKRAKAAEERSTKLKRRSLARLTRLEITDEEEDVHYAELLGSSDRTVCIVASARIERQLEFLLLAHLEIDESDELLDLLFERDGALSTFYGNIRFGRALGFYDKSFQDAMDTIRRIRNQFAHSAAPITFRTDQIKKELDKLPIKEVTDVDDFDDQIEEDSNDGDDFEGDIITLEALRFVEICNTITEKLLGVVKQVLRFKEAALPIYERVQITEASLFEDNL
jgi:hypothetical protein